MLLPAAAALGGTDPAAQFIVALLGRDDGRVRRQMTAHVSQFDSLQCWHRRGIAGEPASIDRAFVKSPGVEPVGYTRILGCHNRAESAIGAELRGRLIDARKTINDLDRIEV